MRQLMRMTICGIILTSTAHAAIEFDFEDGSLQGWTADTFAGKHANGMPTTTTEQAWSGSHALKAEITAIGSSWDYAPCVDVPYAPGAVVTAREDNIRTAQGQHCHRAVGQGVGQGGESRPGSGTGKVVG